MIEREWMTIREVTELLGISRQTLLVWRKEGSIHAAKLSPGKFGRVRVKTESVRARLKIEEHKSA